MTTPAPITTAPTVFAPRFYTVHVTCLVEENQLDEDDLDVPASLEIPLPEGSDAWSESQCATYVLDAFHESVAIHTLDDFEFTVRDPQGKAIFEDD